MTDLVHWVRKQVASDLSVHLRGLGKLSHESAKDGTPVFRVGDDIEFDIILKNSNPFPLDDLDVFVYQVEAVEFEKDPIVGHIQNLASGAEEKVATVKGRIRTNPDDAKSPWRILDYVCRVTVSGEINLPRIAFQDEEFEVAFIRDA